MSVAADSMINTGQQITATSTANATAVVTIPASDAINPYRNYLMGWVAWFSAAGAGTLFVTVAYTDITTEAGVARSVAFPWDFTQGPFYYTLPIDLVGRRLKAMTLTLDAGGGALVGTLTAFYSTK